MQNVHAPTHRNEGIITRQVSTQELDLASDEGQSSECFVSERMKCPQHQYFDVIGETISSFTYADANTIQLRMTELESFRSEVSVDDIYTKLSLLGDEVRDLPSQFLAQLDHLSRIVKVLGDQSFSANVKFDSHYVADISSQALIAFQLLSLNPSVSNITLVFTSILTKFHLPRETLEKCITFIKDAVHLAVVSIASLGYRSEQLCTSFIDVIKGMCGGIREMIQDEVVDIVLTFLAKLVAFWTTLSGGFSDEDFDVSGMPRVVDKLREIVAGGGDIIESLLGTYEWVVENFPKFIKGDFTGLFFGKTETGVYESRTSKICQMYPLVESGSSKILQEEYGMTFASFDHEIDSLIKTGDRMMTKAKPAQKPALKRMIDDLRYIQVNRRIKHAQTQTKVSAYGVCFVGGSAVGKSTIMEQTSRVLISAAGEIPTADKIVTGQMSDKFDSNELPHHLAIQYDDVANNSANENFDKLLNAVNSQARPFLKAGVEEKGIMFPGNVACVISTNVPGLNAKRSNCPDSIARRFLHINVEVKEHLIQEICVPGTVRIDPVKASAGGRARMDLWDFTVFEFITFEYERDDKGNPINLPDGTEMWHNMVVRRLEWTDVPPADRTFWHLAKFLKDQAKQHFASQQVLLERMIATRNEEFCGECCIPVSLCACCQKSEFFSGSLTLGSDRLVEQYMVYHDCFTEWWKWARWRAVFITAAGLAPVHYRQCVSSSILLGICLGVALQMSVLATILFTLIWVILCVGATVMWSWKVIYHDIANRAGILSQLAENSIQSMRDYRDTIFVGASIVSFAYILYRSFRPRSELTGYRESLPEEVRASFARAEKARTTPIDNILPHIKKDIGVMTVTLGARKQMCLAFPIEANFYVTVGHIIPDGEFELEIYHESPLSPTVAKQRLSAAHVYRFEGKDLALIQIPSAVPRRGYLDYLLGRPTPLASQAINLVSIDLDTQTRYVSSTRLEPGWSLLSSTITTQRPECVTLVKPYRYPCNLGTREGMCGSLVVDFSKAIIYGIHVAGNGKVGLCSALTVEDVKTALRYFEGFIPLNQGDLQLGSQHLVEDVGLLGLEVGDDSLDKPIEEHNCQMFGVMHGQGATFKNPYIKHPFKEAIVAEFGRPKFCPPQQINHGIHKRKALTRLTSPNQEFSLRELDHAVADYKKPIVDLVVGLSIADKGELSRPLSLQEALDGVEGEAFYGIDNSTSNGFPYSGRKINHLEPDPFDPTIPAIPRVLVEHAGVNVEEEMQEMLVRYRSGIACHPLFKCSIKTNELLPREKVKARVFMGSNFPFLLLCRQYLGPIIRIMSRHKFLFETAKGINMDSVEAEELFQYLFVEQGDRVVALDYAAFDQTMSAQVSTAAAGIMIDILRGLGCSEDHILIARGILTDITYPTLHYFGTVFRLANSDPSGQPVTTELNGMVNSIYLRYFFFAIYPELVNKISYRDAIRTCTYGDDNINGVPAAYEKFNGINIVAQGAKCGLTITMADKGSDVVAFTTIWESDFLKRKFRRCDDLGRIRAPLSRDSIEKSVHWMKKTSPDPPEVLFSQNVDGMLRKSSQHGRDYFEEIRGKLLRIATKHGVESICKWWEYDELIEHDKFNYYDHYRLALIEADEQFLKEFVCEAKLKAKPPSFTLLLAKFLLIMVGTTVLTTELSVWLADGGRRRLMRALAEYIRRQKASVLDPVMSRVRESHSLNGFAGVAEEFGVPAWVIRSLLPLLGLGFKSEAFNKPVDPPRPYANVLMYIIEWILACFPIMNAGRFSEVGISPSAFTSVLTFSWLAHLVVPTGTLSKVDSVSFARYGLMLKQMFVRHWLRENNELVRPQATCILLEGDAGVGKTTCSLALIKALIPDVKRSEIIVLNEDDEFQSELRSHHRVIVLDDVLNTRPEWLQTSPVRRIIDMVNNVPRRALNPEAELKGCVKVCPELVVITTNKDAASFFPFSYCPQSLVRRWKHYYVAKNRAFTKPLDVAAWDFYPVQYTFSSVGVSASVQGVPPQLFAEVRDTLVSLHERQQIEQRQLVESVNDMFDGEWKSEARDWDSDMVSILKTRDLNPDNFIEEMLRAKQIMLETYTEAAYVDVPTPPSPPPEPPFWRGFWDRIKLWWWSLFHPYKSENLHQDDLSKVQPYGADCAARGWSFFMLISMGIALSLSLGTALCRLICELLGISINPDEFQSQVRSDFNAEFELNFFKSQILEHGCPVVVFRGGVILLRPKPKVLFRSWEGMEVFAGKQYVFINRASFDFSQMENYFSLERLDSIYNLTYISQYNSETKVLDVPSVRGHMDRIFVDRMKYISTDNLPVEGGAFDHSSVWRSESKPDGLQEEGDQHSDTTSYVTAYDDRLASLIDLFGGDSIAGFVRSRFTEFLEHHLASSELPKTKLTPGFINEHLRQKFLVRNIHVAIGQVPSLSEAMAQERVIQLLKSWQLVAREVYLTDENLSCDLIFLKGNTFRFVEAKSSGSQAAKQAAHRKMVLRPLLTGLVVQFTSYTVTSNELKDV